MPSYVGFTTAKKYRRKGCQICGLSFQVLHIDKIREIIYFSTVLFIFHTNIKRGTYFAITHDFFSLHIVRIVYVFRVFVIVTQCKNLIVENKIIITTSDSFHI